MKSYPRGTPGDDLNTIIGKNDAVLVFREDGNDEVILPATIEALDELGFPPNVQRLMRVLQTIELCKGKAN